MNKLLKKKRAFSNGDWSANVFLIQKWQKNNFLLRPEKKYEWDPGVVSYKNWRWANQYLFSSSEHFLNIDFLFLFY